METLHLNLKKKWFDMILSGEKKEEYRELTTYWDSRLTDKIMCDTHMISDKLYLYDIDISSIVWKDLETIIFSNGYAKNRRQMVVDIYSIEIKEGNPEWGAIPGVKYFVIKLGNIHA